MRMKTKRLDEEWWPIERSRRAMSCSRCRSICSSLRRRPRRWYRRSSMHVGWYPSRLLHCYHPSFEAVWQRESSPQHRGKKMDQSGYSNFYFLVFLCFTGSIRELRYCLNEPMKIKVPENKNKNWNNLIGQNVFFLFWTNQVPILILMFFGSLWQSLT